jgi:hypothetical protein
MNGACSRHETDEICINILIDAEPNRKMLLERCT